MRDGSLRDPDVRLGVLCPVIDRSPVGANRKHVVGGKTGQLNRYDGPVARDGIDDDDLPGSVAEVHDVTTVGKPSLPPCVVGSKDRRRVRFEIVDPDA